MQPSANRTVKSEFNSNRLTITLLIIYIVALFWILLFKLGVHFSYMETRSVNLVPFDKLFNSNGEIDKMEIILNIVIFIPLGIYMRVLFTKWSWRQNLLAIALTSLLFEGLQFIFRIGSFDATDIVTNTTGGLTGLLLFEAVKRIFKDGTKTEKFINVIATVGTVIMISLLFLLKLKMLPIRYQ